MKKLWLTLFIIFISTAPCLAAIPDSAKASGQPQTNAKSKINYSKFGALGWFLQGDEHYDKKQYAKAIEAYTKAIELKYYSSAAYNNRGIAYDNNKQYDLAIEDFTTAIKLQPLSQTYNNRGLAYKNIQKYELALADYSKAIELDARNHSVYNNRGILYFELKKYDLAFQDFDKGLAISPKNVFLLCNKATKLDKLKRRPEALAAYQAFLNYAPADDECVPRAKRRIAALSKLLQQPIAATSQAY